MGEDPGAMKKFEEDLQRELLSPVESASATPVQVWPPHKGESSRCENAMVGRAVAGLAIEVNEVRKRWNGALSRCAPHGGEAESLLTVVCACRCAGRT